MLHGALGISSLIEDMLGLTIKVLQHLFIEIGVWLIDPFLISFILIAIMLFVWFRWSSLKRILEKLILSISEKQLCNWGYNSLTSVTKNAYDYFKYLKIPWIETGYVHVPCLGDDISDVPEKQMKFNNMHLFLLYLLLKITVYISYLYAYLFYLQLI